MILFGWARGSLGQSPRRRARDKTAISHTGLGISHTGLGNAWGGRHPEAAELASILRKLKTRLEKESREAKEQGHLDVSLECDEEVGQVGEMWKIMEELNGATIPLEDTMAEL